MFCKEDLTWLPGVSTIMANAEGKSAIDVTLIINGNKQMTVKAPQGWKAESFWLSVIQTCFAMGIVPKKVHVQRAIVKS